MRLNVLGHLEVIDDDLHVHLAGSTQRQLLHALVVHKGSPLGAARLADMLDVSVPALRTAISRLRSETTHEMIITEGGAYRLGDVSTDVAEFEHCLDRARAAGAGDRLIHLDRALGLWRGEPYVDVAERAWALADKARLDEVHAAAVEDRGALLIGLGRFGEAVAALEPHCVSHPLRDRPVGLLMRALAAEGRQAEALRRYQLHRDRLADELGLEPGDELRELEQRLATGWHDEPLSSDGSGAEAGAPSHNLPLSVDAFVGRRDELTGVAAALAEVRLVTLTGVGGAGKTRLAVEAAQRMLTEFADGVWLVELAPVAEATAVPFVVGAAVQVVQQPGKSMLDSLVASLVTRELLLILDNCEHLLDEVAHLVSALESRCAAVKVLATSREGLGLRGEQQLAVPSLPPTDAVELFVARAGAAGAEVAPNDESVMRIVQRLDGLPLAIELAAARTRGLSTQEIEHRLTERFRLLRGGRGRVERHQTLWNTVAWSHQLLEPVDRLVFDRLSVFAGGFTLEAATAVCSGDGADASDVEDAVLNLVERSMVLADTGGDGTRYRLLETLRQFGEAHLLEAGQTDVWRGRHARWFGEFAQLAGAGSKGPDGIAWSRRMRAELDNYRVVAYGEDLPSARRILASLEAWPLFWERFEYIDWAFAVIDPAAPGDPDWIGTAVWAAYGADFAARTDDKDALLARIETDVIPPGMLSYMWSYHQLIAALIRGEEIIPLLRPHLDLASTPAHDYDRLWATSYVSWLAIVLADWTDLSAEIWSVLADDPALDAVPTVKPMFLMYQGFSLASVGDSGAFDCLEAGRRASIQCGNTIFEHGAICYQIPLHVERGDLSTAWQRVTTIIRQQLRSGSHLMLWMALPGLVLLLDESGHRDEAQEIWNELIDRTRLMVPTHRADLEKRLGPPGQPHLDDDQLAARTAEILRQLEQATSTNEWAL